MAKIRIIFTRHAERLPSGNLSSEGLKKAKEKGKSLGSQGQILISYASDHPSKRAFDTAELIAQASKIAAYAKPGVFTKEVQDLSYDVFNPDLKSILIKTKDMIDEATLKDISLSTDRDKNGKLKIALEELPKKKQQEIALIRQKNQRLGFEFWLGHEEVSHRLAMCLAHRLVSEIKESKKYTAYSSVILNNVGHGCFAESLFQIAGKSEKAGGHGRYLDPLESFYFEIDTRAEIPELIPICIERNDRPNDNFFLSYDKLRRLDDEYRRWKSSNI